jgi:RND family efflux transporter MFP subunit
MKSYKASIWIFSFSIFLIFFPACTEKKAVKEETKAPENEVKLTTEQFKTAGIELGGITQKNVRNKLIVNGILDVPPQNLVSVSAVIGGFVRQTEMLQGMFVQQGQLLATLEHPDYVQLQQDYLETQNRLDYAQLDYERQKKLNTENVNATKTFQLATTERNSLVTRLNALTQRLAMLGISPAQLKNGVISRTIGIYASKSGYITAVNVNLGKYVQPNDVMFEISNIEHLHAEIYVFEKDIDKIKIGQDIDFYLANNPDKAYNAKIYLIGKQIEAPDRTVRVHCHFEGEYPNLIPKMYIKAQISVENQLSDVLPEQAVVFFEEKYYIFVQKGTTSKNVVFDLMEVKIGVKENGVVEVFLPEKFDKTNKNSLKIAVKGSFELLSKIKNSEEE